MMPKIFFTESGHGKSPYIPFLNDPGAVGMYQGDKVTERELTVKIGALVLAVLKAKMPMTLVQGVGIETSANVQAKTRYVNTVLRENLHGALPYYNAWGIALHVNSNTDRSGFTGYYQTKRPENKEFLNTILRSMKEYFPSTPIEPVQPAKNSRFHRLYIDDMQCNYVLLEMGYIGNHHDVFQIKEQSERMAESICHGTLEYFRNKQ